MVGVCMVGVQKGTAYAQKVVTKNYMRGVVLVFLRSVQNVAL
ncbi:MAG: hypothetical protein AMQ22_01659 [Candidatus Methanofastidiosum methylothiophilum]|uniref:Uncharacterized protein n=1 Tax=Candidatus Methanofastidiosum methylothiophilum TaxID=1705564 RepID=A0A150IWL4_9EURY|nr:MAG: hypothetical protein AMQ22_01659 [Candidatus Methanofastidiosum methylthiophilus]